MLMVLPKFDYFSCETIEEACSFLSTYNGDAKILAGGTDLLVKMKHKHITPRYLIDIKRVPDLNYICQDESGGVRIGALTTIQAIKNSPVIKKKFSVLNQAASVLGTRQVRNLATLGGNLCNASPAAECAPALITLGAKARVIGVRGERLVSMEEFFVGPGETILQSDEILTELLIPNLPDSSAGVYLKHSTRRVDVAIVGVGAVITLNGKKCQDIKIALGAVGPTPFRAKKAESILRGQELSEELLEKVAEAASAESFPIDDIRGYTDYRRGMIEILVKEGIKQAATQARL
jgi:CO/xanthine dehydrogenase FAD-binding subunit